GKFYEAYPFDNRFASVRLSGASLREVMRRNLEHAKGILSLSGIRVHAACKDGALAVTLVRDDGRPVRDDERLTIVTSDFLAQGGMEGTLGGMADVETHVEEGTLVREEAIAALRKRSQLSGTDTAIFDPMHRRVDYP